jgi:putative transposase
MPVWQLFYHIVWATEGRQPQLSSDVEPVVYGFLRSKATALGARVFALNGAADHVHMIAAVPPKLALATFIGQIKGVASARYNQSEGIDAPLHWQDGYAVFSLDAKRLPYHIAYVEQQKEHHAAGTTFAILERTGGELATLREMSAEYGQETEERDEIEKALEQ